MSSAPIDRDPEVVSLPVPTIKRLIRLAFSRFWAGQSEFRKHKLHKQDLGNAQAPTNCSQLLDPKSPSARELKTTLHSHPSPNPMHEANKIHWCSKSQPILRVIAKQITSISMLITGLSSPMNLDVSVAPSLPLSPWVLLRTTSCGSVDFVSLTLGPRRWSNRLRCM